MCLIQKTDFESEPKVLAIRLTNPPCGWPTTGMLRNSSIFAKTIINFLTYNNFDEIDFEVLRQLLYFEKKKKNWPKVLYHLINLLRSIVVARTRRAIELLKRGR